MSCRGLGKEPTYEVRIDKPDPPPDPNAPEVERLECDWCNRKYYPYELTDSDVEEWLCRRCAVAYCQAEGVEMYNINALEEARIYA